MKAFAIWAFCCTMICLPMAVVTYFSPVMNLAHTEVMTGWENVGMVGVIYGAMLLMGATIIAFLEWIVR